MMAAVEMSAEDGKQAMRGITIEVDTTKARRAMFGRGEWRLKVACFLFRLGARILRCQIEIDMHGPDTKNEEPE